MEDIVLNKKNFDIIRNFCNEQITKKYGVEIKNQYDDDISVVMKKMWEKNSNKKIADPKRFLTNWNQKVIEYCTNMIDNSIQSAYLNYSNNTLFGGDNPPVNIDKMAKDRGYGKQVEPKPSNLPQPADPNPVFTNQYREQINEKNASDLFEKIVANRGVKQTEIRNKGNLDNNNYSSNNYQNNPNTYKNTIPPQKEFVNASNLLNNNPPVPESDLVNLANNFIHPNQNILPNNSAQETLDEFFKSNNLATQFDYNDRPSIEGQIVKSEIAQRNLVIQKPIQDEIVNAELENINMNVSRNNNISQNIQKQVMDKEVIQTQTPDPLEEIRKQQIEHEKKLEEMNSWLNNNTSLNYPLIPVANMKLETQTVYLVIDSFYRDLGLYPSPAHFLVNFGDNGNSFEINSRLNQNGVVIYDKPKLFESVGGNGANLENRYSNVFRIRCVDVILPFDRRFVVGETPYNFNNGKTDQNVLEGPAVFRSNRYGPIWSENDGIHADITEEPYYMLVIDEIQSPYDGTSKDNRKGLAKLLYDKTYGCITQFLRYKTSSDETYEYSPAALGTLSRMNLNIVKPNGVPLDLGVDKIFVNKIEEGTLCENDKYGCNLNGFHLTKITITFENPEYKEKLCSTGLYPGDILYFSSTFNCSDFVPFKKDVKINIDNYPVVYYYIEIEKNGVIYEERVNVSEFLKPLDYLVIDNCLFQIKAINQNQTILVIENGINPADIPRKKLGFAPRVKRGFRSDDLKELNSINGFRVAGNNIGQYTFEINYPYECLPSYYKSDECYYANEIFFIQHRKQISYTFQIEQLIKSSKDLTAHIVSHSVT
jgi:hypothetical protein